MTVEEVNTWLTGAEEESYSQVVTDEEIIADAEADKEEAEGEVGTPQPVSCDAAMTLFAMAIAWAEENGGSAYDILTL